MKTYLRNPRTLLLAFSVLIYANPSWADFRGFDKSKQSYPTKREAEVRTESSASIARRRVVISQKVVGRQSPLFSQLKEFEFERARKVKVDEKTSELIKQLEELINREGQQGRIGELKMRLAELYYDRGVYIASQESEGWESAVKKWETLSEAERGRVPRPTLKTPKADQYRKRTISLYSDLERLSRGPDKGVSQQIRREEVLFFLASTMMDLGQRKNAAPYYEELVRVYPDGSRAFSARLNLADYNFEIGKFDKAIPYYLQVAAGKGAPRNEDTDHIKAYGLYKLGWCYMNLGQHDKAVLALKKTAEMARNSKNDRRIILEKEALNDLARAFALAFKFDEGERYFSNLGDSAEEAHDYFRQESAAIARDNGRLDIAARFYGQMIDKNPKADQARDYAYERLQAISKGGDAKAYKKALEEFSETYGANSSWMSGRSSDVKQALTEELVSLLRREAKNNHREAQQKDSAALFNQTKSYYQLYFKNVPKPNPDSAENVHEMKFYYAELLYKTEDYKEAAKAYDEVGEGKYLSTAAYARILALKMATGKDKNVSRELISATEEFIAKFPKDERASELLYSSAQEAFNSGDTKESISTLEKVLERFGDRATGAEAAERILFILEKEGDINGAMKRSNEFLGNKALVAAGGPEFEKRLRELVQRAEFKKAESFDGDDAAKASEFFEIAKKSKGEIREKALNNALVFARKGGNVEVQRQAQKMMIAEYPNSEFSKGIYFEMGETAAHEGNWEDAVKWYNSFLKSFFATSSKDKKSDSALSKETENAEWNRLYIMGSLEDVWFSELFPDSAPSAEVLRHARDFLEHYPRSKNRSRIVEMLAFRKGSDSGQLVALKRLPSLSEEERNILSDAEVIIAVRDNKNLEAWVKRYPSSKVNSAVMRHALGLAAFRVTEPKYKNYMGQKLNYSMAKFASTLKSKISALEKLEKDYMGVVSYGNGEWALKSLDRLSSLYRGLAADIEKAPAPKEELQQFSKPIHDKGVGFLKTCLDKATELKIGGEGVATCRSTASKLGASFATLTDDLLPRPKWIPLTQGLTLTPLVKVGLEAARKGRWGEANLAQDLIAKDEAKLSGDEVAILDIVRGLSNVSYKAYEPAARSFRKASESGQGSIKAAASKNLAALYLELSDFSQASDATSSLSPSTDSDSALLAGLAARGQGDNATAIGFYVQGLQKTPNQSEIHFNKSLAHAAMAQFDEAIKSISRYVEMEAPSANHVSRELLRRFKAQAAGEGALGPQSGGNNEN